MRFCFGLVYSYVRWSGKVANLSSPICGRRSRFMLQLSSKFVSAQQYVQLFLPCARVKGKSSQKLVCWYQYLHSFSGGFGWKFLLSRNAGRFLISEPRSGETQETRVFGIRSSLKWLNAFQAGSVVSSRKGTSWSSSKPFSRPYQTISCRSFVCRRGFALTLRS